VLMYDGEYECHPGLHAGCVHEKLFVILGVVVNCTVGSEVVTASLVCN
jgi:hypothetical protein